MIELGERWFKWLNRAGKQTAWRMMLWHCRMLHEERTALKQRVRQLEADHG